MIASAGQVALALAIVRMAGGRTGWSERLLLIAGAIFVSAKFSGPVLLVLLTPVWLWLLGGRLRDHWRWLLGGAAAWMASVGHVYVRNAWVHGNPVYPSRSPSVRSGCPVWVTCPLPRSSTASTSRRRGG